MKTVLFFLLVTFGISAGATVRFASGDWHVGDSKQLILKSVGVATDEAGIRQAALNFESREQIVLSDAHLDLGLSLMAFKGQCLKVIPGQYLKSVNVISTCD